MLTTLLVPIDSNNILFNKNMEVTIGTRNGLRFGYLYTFFKICVCVCVRLNKESHTGLEQLNGE